MGLSTPESTVSILHVMNGITGAAIKIPDGINAMLQPGGGVMDAINAYIGSCPEGAGFASLTCGPGIGPRPAPISIFSKGLNQFLGITLCDGELNVKGTGMTVTAAKSLFSGGTWKYAGTSFTVAGNVTMAGKTGAIGFADTVISGKAVKIASPALTLNGRNWMQVVSAVDVNSAKKPFDIKHPSKEGWRLRYVCLEGPTADVYLKGKLRGESVINLPDYWKDLVDIETITVSLTPTTNYQELFVKKVESDYRIIIGNQAGSAVNCDYVVFGERKDTGKNIPEYEGQTPKDYPGDNDEYMNTVSLSSIWSK